jgi:hypothetical protein
MPRDNQGVASALTYPPKPARGDSAAILSPSGRSPSRFPAPFELGLRRRREECDLVPVDTQQRARRVLRPQSAREISMPPSPTSPARMSSRCSLGHTEPQYVIPNGGDVIVDSERQRIEVIC